MHDGGGLKYLPTVDQSLFALTLSYPPLLFTSCHSICKSRGFLAMLRGHWHARTRIQSDERCDVNTNMEESRLTLRMQDSKRPGPISLIQ